MVAVAKEGTTSSRKWVAVREFKVHDHNRDIYQIVRFLNYGNLI